MIIKLIPLAILSIFLLFTKGYSGTLSNGFFGGNDAQVYLQMGNAYQKNNQLSLAVYAYESGLIKNPFNTEIRHNLNLLLLKQGLPARAEEHNGWKIMDHIVLVMLLMILVLSVIYFLNACWFVRFSPLLVRRVIILLIFGFIVLFGSSLLFWASKSNKQAINISKNATCKLGPNKDAKTIFFLKEGEKIKVFKRYLNWTKIENSLGQVAWVPSNQLKQLTVY